MSSGNRLNYSVGEKFSFYITLAFTAAFLFFLLPAIFLGFTRHSNNTSKHVVYLACIGVWLTLLSGCFAVFGSITYCLMGA